jgi:hypothetical protein
MIRELTQNELSDISGGVVVSEGYFTLLQGYEVVGYSQDLIGWDTVSWTEPGLFGRTFVTDTPIYDIQPIYAPIMTTTTTTYYY